MMPLGSSTLQFVTYNFDDVPSEITVRDYLYLIDQSEVTAAEAANIITVYRYSQGNMTDTDGNLQYLTGRLLFMCENGKRIVRRKQNAVQKFSIVTTIELLHPKMCWILN